MLGAATLLGCAQSLRDSTAIPLLTPYTPNHRACEDGLRVRLGEVARLVAEGPTDREIAVRLFISNRTVETHVTNMLNKLGISSRTQLARWLE